MERQRRELALKTCSALEDADRALRFREPGEAIAALQRATALLRRLSPEAWARELLAASLVDQATLLRGTGRFEEARAPLREAIAIRRTQAGADAKLAAALNDLAMVITERGRPNEEAESAQREAVGIYRRVAQSDAAQRIYLAKALNGLGNFLRKSGRPEEAEAAYAEAQGIIKRFAGPRPQLYEMALTHTRSKLESVLRHNRWIPDPDLEEAMRCEEDDPRAAAQALRRAERTNRSFSYPALLLAVGAMLVAGTAAFPTNAWAAFAIYVGAGFFPPMLHYFLRQQPASVKLLITAVIGALVMFFQQVLIIVAGLVISILAALVIGPLVQLGAWILGVTVPDALWWAIMGPLIALGLAIVLADVMPIVLLSPRRGMAEIVAGLRRNLDEVLQFGAGILVGSLIVGTGTFGLLYSHWWQAITASGIGGLLLGLTLAPLDRDGGVAQLIMLSRARLDIRRGRYGSARWRLRRLLERDPFVKRLGQSGSWATNDLIQLQAGCLQRTAGRRWWDTATTFDQMGGAFIVLVMGRSARREERESWHRDQDELAATLEQDGPVRAQRTAHDRAWADSVRNTLRLLRHI